MFVGVVEARGPLLAETHANCSRAISGVISKAWRGFPATGDERLTPFRVGLG